MLMKIFILLLIFSWTSSYADILVGTGMSKVTQGRTVPALYLGIDKGSEVIQFSSLGVETEIYYHNSYRFSFYKQSAFGSVFGIKQRAGLGIGVLYARRAYREDKDTKEEVETDFNIGPAFRFSLDITDYMFVSLESMYGINNLLFLVLSFQNTSSINFGVRF
jgi:hypothetical protein